MAVGLRSSTAQAFATGTTVTLNKPTGLADGDVLVAYICATGATPTVTPPSGWRQVAVFTNIGTFRKRVYYRRVYDAASEPASWTWTHSVSSTNGGFLAAIQDVSLSQSPRFAGTILGTIVHPSSTLIGQHNNYLGHSTLSSGTPSTPQTDYITIPSGGGYIMASFFGSGSGWTSESAPSGTTHLNGDTGNLLVAGQSISSGSVSHKVLSGPNGNACYGFMIGFDDIANDQTIGNVVETETEVGTSLGSSNAQTLPRGSETGDLILVAVANDNSSTTLTASTGWEASTELSAAASLHSRLFARVLDGSGDDALSITGASQDYVVAPMRIPAALHSKTNASLATWLANFVATNTGTGSTYTFANLNPGVSKNYRWLAILAGDHTTTGWSFGTHVDEAWETLSESFSASSSSTKTELGVYQLIDSAAQSSYTPSLTRDSPTSITTFHAWTVALEPVADPDADISATVVTGAGSVPAPSLPIGATATPSVVTAAASVPAPTVAAGNASAAPSVVTSAGSAPSPLVFTSGLATATVRNYVYIDEFVASLALVTPRGSDRVIIQSSIDGELATLGMDDVEGDLDPPVPTPPNLPPLPPGTPDPPTPPGGGSPIPVPPDLDPPPGTVDPGHPGELEQLEGPYVFWDSRIFRTGTTLNMGGASEEALSTDFWARLTPGSYNAAAGNLGAILNGWETSDFATGMRIWSSGQFGGNPYGTTFTWVLGIRPDAVEVDPNGGATLQLGGPSSGAGYFQWQAGLGTIDGERRLGVRVFHQSADVDTDGAGSPLPGPFPGQWMDITWATSPGDLEAVPVIAIPDTQTSVLVVTTGFPTGEPIIWLNQELIGPLYSRVRLLPSEEESTIFNWTRPFYTTPTPTGPENDFADFDSVSAKMTSTDSDFGAYGSFAQAMFRGSPNENDLAVLQWRYGQ